MCERHGAMSRRATLKTLALVAGSGLLPASATAGERELAFMREAQAMRELAIGRGDPAYGAVIVRGEEIVGRGASSVVTLGDPTAHAEMIAIRDACRRLATTRLSDCVMYGTTRACPMCETAAYWAKLAELRYSEDAIPAGPPGYPRC